MKLKINTDGKEYFIVKDDEGVKVTEKNIDDINFSEQEAVKVDTLSEISSNLVYIFSNDLVVAIIFLFFGCSKSNVGLPCNSCFNRNPTTAISLRTHSSESKVN